MTFADAKAIYNHMQDEISRKLFISRMNVSVTGDAGYITMLPAEYRNLSADIENFRNGWLTEDKKQTVIMGAGFNGVAIARQLHIKSLHPNLPKLLYIGFKLIPQIPYKIGV